MCLWPQYYLHLAQLFLYTTTVIIHSVRYLDDREKAEKRIWKTIPVRITPSAIYLA